MYETGNRGGGSGRGGGESYDGQNTRSNYGPSGGGRGERGYFNGSRGGGGNNQQSRYGGGGYGSSRGRGGAEGQGSGYNRDDGGRRGGFGGSRGGSGDYGTGGRPPRHNNDDNNHQFNPYPSKIIKICKVCEQPKHLQQAYIDKMWNELKLFNYLCPNKIIHWGTIQKGPPPPPADLENRAWIEHKAMVEAKLAKERAKKAKDDAEETSLAAMRPKTPVQITPPRAHIQRRIEIPSPVSRTIAEDHWVDESNVERGWAEIPPRVRHFNEIGIDGVNLLLQGIMGLQEEITPEQMADLARVSGFFVEAFQALNDYLHTFGQ